MVILRTVLQAFAIEVLSRLWRIRMRDKSAGGRARLWEAYAKMYSIR